MRRLAREIRKAAKCGRCGTAVRLGVLLELGQEKVCQPCAVKEAQDRKSGQERRLETA